MLTRCPHCATTFRVTPEQLKARAGRVRCGECRQVFNALDALVETLAPVAEPVVIEATAIEPAVAEVVAPLEPEPTIPDDPSALDDPVVPAEPEPVTPTLEPWLHEAPPRRAWPWVVAGILALTVLLGQAIWYFRTEIAALQPQAKPWLKDYCDLLGCDLPLPRKVELIGIDSSDLHPDPSGAAGRLLMSAQLRNRAPFAQEFPHLELTLTDAADHALVRRVLAPADYLPPQTLRDQGFRANAELNVHLLIESGDTPAAGYRLYLFFP